MLLLNNPSSKAKINSNNIIFSYARQGEAIITVDKGKKAPYNAIVTFDSRTKDMYRLFDKKSGKQAIFEQTGIPLPPMYPTHKILWIKADMVRLYKRAHKFFCFEYFVFFKLG